MYEENREGVSGWFRVRRYSLEKVLYALHRLTGIGIIIYIIVHLMYTSWHPGGWGDIILGILVVYHSVNGIRLLLAEYGFVLGKTYRPVYPYRRGTIYGSQRYFTIAMMIIAIILLVVWGYVALVIQG